MHAKVPGRVAEILVAEGDTVQAGQTLAVLDDSEQRLTLAAAKSKLRAAQAAARTAWARLREVSTKVGRARALVAEQALPPARLQDLTARHLALQEQAKAADAQAAATRSDVSLARSELEARTIVAPITGTIIAQAVRVGESAGPGLGPIAEIADPRSLAVETDVPEARVRLAAVGTAAEIQLDAHPDARFAGTTRRIGRRVNKATGTVVVVVAFDDTTRDVLVNMSARVRFLDPSSPREDASESEKRLVAREAVAMRDGSPVLFVLSEGTLRTTSVRVRPAGDGFVEVLEGPPAGTRVVHRPTKNNFDGQHVQETD